VPLTSTFSRQFIARRQGFSNFIIAFTYVYGGFFIDEVLLLDRNLDADELTDRSG